MPGSSTLSSHVSSGHCRIISGVPSGIITGALSADAATKSSNFETKSFAINQNINYNQITSKFKFKYFSNRQILENGLNYLYLCFN